MSPGRDRLTAYQAKRDFTRTAEPAGSGAAPQEREPEQEREEQRARFVVQLHDATAMHFDFRLEADGVLKSWAVPKGPPASPRDKRLAVPTEDHPLEYRHFEGVIAEGEYGAGPVIIWDEGDYTNLTKDAEGRPVAVALGADRGHISFDLHGTKLRGAYALTRIRNDAGDGREAWLLVKAKAAGGGQDGGGAPDPRRARSVRTGRTLNRVGDGARGDDTRHDEVRAAPRRPPARGNAPLLSRPDKVLFPGDGITKADVVDYYRRVGAAALPHLRGRPLMMERHPDGISGRRIMQKEVPGHFPDWVHRAELPEAHGSVTYALCDSRASLQYLAGQACLTLHRWLSKADRPHRPDRLVFDLDPDGDDFPSARTAAGRLRSLLEDELSLPTALMTTGSRGLHVLTPLDRGAAFDEVREFARDCASLLAARHPDQLTVDVRKASRRGRLFLDTGSNAYARTAVAPYSLRALPGAPVAMPISWEELADPRTHARRWTLATVDERLRDDPWAGARPRGRSLGPARRRLAALTVPQVEEEPAGADERA